MFVGKKEYGTWKDGSSIYKDVKGYYVVAVNINASPNNNPMYKKYLKKWRPFMNTEQLCFMKKRWTMCKNKKKLKETRKNH